MRMNRRQFEWFFTWFFAKELALNIYYFMSSLCQSLRGYSVESCVLNSDINSYRILFTLLLSRFFFFRSALLSIHSSLYYRFFSVFYSLIYDFVVLFVSYGNNSTFSPYQKRDDARQFMNFLHPDLGVGNAIQACKFSFYILYFQILMLMHQFY